MFKVKAMRAKQAAKAIPKSLNAEDADKYAHLLAKYEAMDLKTLQQLCRDQQIPHGGTVLDLAVRLARVR